MWHCIHIPRPTNIMCQILHNQWAWWISVISCDCTITGVNAQLSLHLLFFFFFAQSAFTNLILVTLWPHLSATIRQTFQMCSYCMSCPVNVLTQVSAVFIKYILWNEQQWGLKVAWGLLLSCCTFRGLLLRALESQNSHGFGSNWLSRHYVTWTL